MDIHEHADADADVDADVDVDVDVYVSVHVCVNLYVCVYVNVDVCKMYMSCYAPLSKTSRIHLWGLEYIHCALYPEYVRAWYSKVE